MLVADDFCFVFQPLSLTPSFLAFWLLSYSHFTLQWWPPPLSIWLTAAVHFFSTVPRINGHSKSERTARDSAMGYDSASVMSSELESSSFVDSEEDEDASR